MNLKKTLIKYLGLNENEDARSNWIKETLRTIPSGMRILDAGAGELRNKPLCAHLQYVSQDVCEYDGAGDHKGLQTGVWNTSQIDLISDIANIPADSASFDVILCSEVFEHLPDALKALDEFSRLLKPGGKLIITAPFSSMVHFAPYHFATGFSRYWYEYHLPMRNFRIETLMPNGDWFSLLKQEVVRLPGMARRYGTWSWPVAYLAAAVILVFLALRKSSVSADDIACFGWHCVAVKYA